MSFLLNRKACLISLQKNIIATSALRFHIEKTLNKPEFEYSL
jgi:hypothetical protein